VSGIFFPQPDHADVERTYTDDEPEGRVYGQRPGPPDGLSWRHVECYRVLATFADHEGRGARVKHATLGARMRPPLKARRVRELMAGLYEAGWVVPHPQLVDGRPGGRRRGANRYFLTRPWWALPEPPTVRQSPPRQPSAQLAPLGNAQRERPATATVRHSPEAPNSQVAPLGTATRVPNRTSSATRSLKREGSSAAQKQRNRTGNKLGRGNRFDQNAEAENASLFEAGQYEAADDHGRFTR
jgi:hypothetical protein